jgi:hypothetical protein
MMGVCVWKEGVLALPRCLDATIDRSDAVFLLLKRVCMFSFWWLGGSANDKGGE